MDILTQSAAYLSELASTAIQCGSNSMGSVSNCTEFGSALRQFELVRRRIDIDPMHFDIDPASNKY